MDYQQVTITGDSIEMPDPLLVWHIAPTADGYMTIYNSAAGQYAAGNGTKNMLVLTGTLNNYAKWTPSGTSAYEFVNLGNKNAGQNSNLRKNESYGFSCYSVQTGGALTLFKASAGTVFYCTGTCNHENTVAVEAVAATCTATGFTAGVYCEECENYISGHQMVDMLPHAWDEGRVILEATFEDQGEMEYTCGTCGKREISFFDKPLAALEGTSMTLGDSLAVAFVFDITKLEEDGAVASITKSYADGRADVTVEIPQEAWKVFSGNLYYFAFEGVAAKEMCDSLSVAVFNAYGTQITEPYTDTIQAYAMRMLEMDETLANEELRTLYVDMLIYGAAAQVQFGYGTEQLADAMLSQEQRAYATGTCTTENNLVEGPGRTATTMTLKSHITLDFIFSNAVAFATDSIEGYANRMADRIPAMVEAIVKFGTSAYNYFH